MKSQFILVLAPTSELHLDKRILQACNSLANSGHQVHLLARPQSSENTDRLASMLSENVHYHPLSFHYPESFYSLESSSFTALRYQSKLFALFTQKLTQLIDPQKRSSSSPYWNRLAGTSFVKLNRFLSKNEWLNDFYLFFHLGPKRYLQFRKVLQLDFWNAYILHVLLKLTNSTQFDLIYANDIWSLPLGVLIKDLLKVPLVYDSHEIALTVIDCPKQQAIVRKSEKWLYRAVDRMLTVNDSVAKHYKDRFPFLNPAVVVNAPFAVKSLPSKESSPLYAYRTGRDPLIGIVATFLGRFHGLDEFFKALQLTQNPVNLVIIGEGSAKSALIEKSKEMGIFEKKVFFRQGIPFDEVVPLISGADFGLIPNKRDLNLNLNSPSKLYEYVQAELPIFSDEQIEVDKVLQRHPIGMMVDLTLDPKSVAQRLDWFCERLKSNAYSDALKAAKKELKWPDHFSDLVINLDSGSLKTSE